MGWGMCADDGEITKKKQDLPHHNLPHLYPLGSLQSSSTHPVASHKPLTMCNAQLVSVNL